MRSKSLRFIGALGIAAVWAVSAHAAPTIPSPNPILQNIVKVQGVCGGGYHLTYWGGCVPNYYENRNSRWRNRYYRNRYWRRRY